MPLSHSAPHLSTVISRQKREQLRECPDSLKRFAKCDGNREEFGVRQAALGVIAGVTGSNLIGEVSGASTGERKPVIDGPLIVIDLFLAVIADALLLVVEEDSLPHSISRATITLFALGIDVIAWGKFLLLVSQDRTDRLRHAPPVDNQFERAGPYKFRFEVENLTNSIPLTAIDQ